MREERLKLVLSAGMLLAFLFACTCTPKQLASVDLPFTPQHRDWWCWAAVTEMISQFYGHRVDQCDSAEYIGGGNCCTGCTGDCDCWGWPWGATVTDIDNNWTHWDFTYTSTSSSLTWEELRDAIDCEDSPLMVWWTWKPLGTNGAHVVAAYGYVEAAGQQFVSYYDPWAPDCQKVGNVCSHTAGGDEVVNTYAAFTETGGHLWNHTWYDFTYTGD